MFSKLKHFIYHTLEFNNKSHLSMAINGLIITLILLSVPVDVIESVGDATPQIKRLVWHLDLFITLVFGAEYLLRVYSCTQDPRYKKTISGRIRFMLTPLMLIDLIAIAPFFILGAGYLRMLRVFRILMLMRYTNAIQLMNNVVSQKKKELAVCGAFMLMLWVWSAFMIYRVEHAAQPLVFKNILDALWWSVVTFTTIGYGDIYPITYFGKAIAAITVAMGLLVFAVTTAVLTAGIVQQMHAATDAGKKPPEV